MHLKVDVKCDKRQSDLWRGIPSILSGITSCLVTQYAQPPLSASPVH